MKTFLLFTALFSYAFTQEISFSDYFENRHDPQSAKLGSIEFKKLSDEENNRSKKCHYLYKASYLQFLYATSFTLGINPKSETYKKNYKTERKLLEETITLNEQCINLLGLQGNDYKKLYIKINKLPLELKELYALHLQNKITSLSRILDIVGNTSSKIQTAAFAGPLWKKEIRPSTKMLISSVKTRGIKMGHIFHQAAFRISGLAHTNVPSIIGGSLDLAKTHLQTAVDKTLWNGRNISQYIFNSIAQARYFKKTKNTAKACSILKEILLIKPEIAKREIPELYPEFVIDQKVAKLDHEIFRCP